MVTILPPERTGWDVLGKQVGEAMGQTFIPALQQMQTQKIQQNLLNKNIDEYLSQLQQTGKLTPELEAILGLTKATGATPGAVLAQKGLPALLESIKGRRVERPGFENVMQSIQDIAYGKQPLPQFLQKPQEALGTQIEGKTPIVKPEKEDVISKISEKLGEKYFPIVKPMEERAPGETYKPIPKPTKPLPIGPKEKAKIRKDLISMGIDRKSEQDEYINDAMQFQRDAYESALSGFESIEDFRNAKINEDNRFFSIADPLLKDMYGSMTPDQMNVWKGISRLAENSGPDESRLRNTNQMYNQLVYEPLRSFDQLSPALPTASLLTPGIVKNRLEDSRSMVQDHLKSIENRKDIPDELKSEIKNLLRDQYMTSMSGKDWGTAQSSYVVSNISDKIKNSIPKVTVIQGKHFEPISDLSKPELREKYIEKLSDSLYNNLSNDDSLILVREQAIKNNYDESSFNEALRRAVQRGKVLSDFQRMERPKLSIPQRLDLNSILEGKRSIFDLFKAKK